jgi:hypothetical protein
MYEELLKLIKSDDLIEPETLRTIFPDESEDKINEAFAFITLYKTRFFWENFFIFEKIVLALNEIKPDFTMLQGAAPEQIWYAIEVAHNLYPTREFAPEINKYIEFMFNEYGVYVYPPYLELPNPYYAKALDLSMNGPFPLGDGTTEEIQANRLLAILTYTKSKQ